MQQADHQQYGPQRINQLLSGVPFFNEIARDDHDQYLLLVANTGIKVAGAGEQIIRAGDVDTTLYFLLRGQLEVLAEKTDEPPLYYVSPGEVFGTLSMLLGTPRSATIRVADSAREAVLASLDFNDFNDDQQTPYTLQSRLAFYHMLVHHIRWTLEVKRMQMPDHELVQSMRKLPVFHGEKGTEAELETLKIQAQALAELLCRWNEEVLESTGTLQLI
ncbi:MAG: cyclic nucleotide-binding domain-containing protein [Alcanivorax sp.]|nr:cyclic nucleotide-binding domain-containing protein [Alcanivorax sp.]